MEENEFSVLITRYLFIQCRMVGSFMCLFELTPELDTGANSKTFGQSLLISSQKWCWGRLNFKISERFFRKLASDLVQTRWKNRDGISASLEIAKFGHCTGSVSSTASRFVSVKNRSPFGGGEAARQKFFIPSLILTPTSDGLCTCVVLRN